MKKLILTLFTVIAFINVQAQCNSNPISDNGASGTVNFSDSSTVSSSFSTNYSVSYLWNFGDGFTSTQQSPCHTYGDLSNITYPLYATLSVTYLDSTTFNFCQDIDSVPVYILINPCVYGDLQISASGNNLTANWTYSVGGSPGCSNNYADTYLWSNGDTNQTITATTAGVYSCTVTTSTGCVYTTSYNYNGSLNLTFDCSQMDIFEANNDYNTPSFQSAYLNNNDLFPELIDSLSVWDVYDANGINIGLYPMIWQGAPSTFSVQNIGSNGLPSDSLYVCYEAYLYDSLYQHNLWVSPPQGSVCFDCEWLVWDATSNSWVNGNYGCTDSLALNFDSTATFDDGSCLYCDLTTSFTNILPSDSIICDGVSIVTANSSYPIVSYSWEDQFGNIVSTNDYGLNLCNDIYFVTVVDSSGCTSLDTLLFGSIYGCTDPLSFNYFWGATVDDGSCIATVYGCTDSLALNYDSTANIDDGSCCLINQLLGQIGQDIDGEAAGDYSGWSVSLSSDGNRVAIGAPFNDGNGSGAGHVRIYENISGTWSQIGQDIDGEADDDMFGFSLSSSSNGSVVAIGAYRNDENGSNSGHVRIYENIGGSWSQIGQDIDGEAADDFFGYSVSLSSDGSTVAIGASALLVPGSGYVRIYENIVGTWSQIGQDIDGEATDDQSGTSVSLSSNGSTVAIGAPLNDGNGLNSGHVRIYENFGGIWTQIGQDINGEATDDQSGTSVSLSSDGSTVAIGATGNDGNGSTSGHVRIYENIVGTWSQIGQDIDGEAVGDNSGWSVSLGSDGNRVAIGAYGIDAGHVRIYENIGGSWFQIGQDIDGESVGDNSGYSVSLSSDGNSVAIGAPWSFSSYSGYVRVFNSSTSLCAGCIDPLALNYDSTFAYDDGSCIYPTGCTDPTAYNYDTIAITDDGSCLYCDLTNTFVVNNNTPGNCNGFIIANSSSSNTPLTYLWSNGGTGTNITGLCAGVYSVIITDDVGCQIIDTTYIGLFGCTDSLAFNYDSLANFDDGSCIPFIYGCTDSLSLNYNSFANTDDGSCLYCVYGCIDLLACNYDSLATCDDGSCLINYGCTDTLALNYDALAQCDDGSCLYCIYGCMDPTALNYDINATCDDGSCSYSSNCSSPKPNGLYSYDVIDTRAKIGWNNMNDANCIVLKYFVRYREVGTNSWTTKSAGVGNGLCIFGLNTVDKQLLNLTASTAYEFKMKAFYCGGTSSNYSPAVQFTTSDVCPEMTNLTATTFNGNQSKVRFNWDTTGAYTFARILLRVDTAGANWQTAGGFGVYYPTFLINKFGLQSGESYRAQGRTFCDSNITAYRSPTWTSPIFWTQPGSIKLDGGVSINNLDVYPNPSMDVFNISFNSETLQDLNIRILNIVGAEIYKETKDQFIGEYTKQISLDNYGKGIYFLEIETNDGVINKKLILQ